MRGKVGGDCQETGNVRITPAYAGKRTLLFTLNLDKWDHPRLCGEKPTLKHLHLPTVGSPPPMRGKAAPSVADLKSVRITPAYAGKRSICTILFFTNWDHPRLCGEKTGNRLKYNFITGSPPPMRGKAGSLLRHRFHQWITPAYAGKSL